MAKETKTEKTTKTKKRKRGTSLNIRTRHLFLEMLHDATNNDGVVSDAILEKASNLEQELPVSNTGLSPELKLADVDTKISELYEKAEVVDGKMVFDEAKMRTLLNRKQRLEREINKSNES